MLLRVIAMNVAIYSDVEMRIGPALAVFCADIFGTVLSQTHCRNEREAPHDCQFS